MIPFPAIWWLFPAACLLLSLFSLYLTRSGGLENAPLQKGFVALGALLGFLALALPLFEQPVFRVPLIHYGLGIPLAVIGLVGRIYPMVYLKRQGTTTAIDGVVKLVDTGPYRWVRHPQYTAGFLLLWGWFLAWGALYSLGMLPLLAGLMFIQALIEEKNVLEKRFGAAYAAYRQQVGMFVPRLTTTSSALRITVAFLGLYAGMVGIQHGVLEILQGNTAPAGLLFNAIGPPCRPETAWHACFPAMSLIPNLLVTGIAAVIVGTALQVWALFFVQRRYGGWGLGLLATLLLLVGGGFVPVFIGMAAAIASRGLGRSPAQPRLAFLGALWPWPLVVMALWLPGSWLLGHFFGAAMLSAGGLLFLVFDIALPVLAALTGYACPLQARCLRPPQPIF